MSIKVRAPGKVILHGEHAVVYYKPAIAVSVAIFTDLEIQSTNSNHVCLNFDQIGLNLTIKLNLIQELQQKLGPDFSYKVLDTQNPITLAEPSLEIIQGFVNNQAGLNPNDKALVPVLLKASEAFVGLYAAIFKEKLEPLIFSVKTELPMPVVSGLGSSASFGVAVVAGMLISTGRISKDLNVTENKEKVNHWAFLSEKFVHGSPSGIDNYLTTFGGAILFQRQLNGLPDKAESLDAASALRILLVDTEVTKSTQAIIQKVATLKETRPEVWQKCMDDIGELVEKAAENIRNKRVQSVQFLENHQHLQQLGVSHQRLDKIIELAGELGFHGKLTGVGGGGCALVFLPQGEPDERVNSLKISLNAAGFSFWDTSLGCQGVELVI